MTRPTILLFDIDGTLVTTGGAGRRAVDRAFDRVHGRPDACLRIRFDGMTDRLIGRLGLEAIGVTVTEAAIDALLSAYIAELALELGASGTPAYGVHSGVHEALTAARARGHQLGLGTGNVLEGARLKLEHVDLYRYFEFGGFGSDAEARVDVIRHGAERGAARLGLSPSACRVVVIGDTPKDIDAARGVGAESIGVGTGSFSPAELRAAGATYAFDDLTSVGALKALLGD